MKAKVTYTKNGVNYFLMSPSTHPSAVQRELLKRQVGMSSVVKIEKVK